MIATCSNIGLSTGVRYQHIEWRNQRDGLEKPRVPILVPWLVIFVTARRYQRDGFSFFFLKERNGRDVCVCMAKLNFILEYLLVEKRLINKEKRYD